MKAFDTIQGGPEDDSTSDSDFEDEQGGTVSLALPDVCVCKNCRLCKYSCSLCVPFPQAAIVAFYIFYSIAYLPYRIWNKLTFVKTFFAKTKTGFSLFLGLRRPTNPTGAAEKRTVLLWATKLKNLLTETSYRFKFATDMPPVRTRTCWSRRTSDM